MSVDEARQFLNDNFLPVNTEFEAFTPTDWTPNPSKLLNRINNAEYKQFALALNSIWKELGRKISDKVGQNPQQYSLMYVNEPFIVPGGRFREFYCKWFVSALLIRAILLVKTRFCVLYF